MRLPRISLNDSIVCQLLEKAAFSTTGVSRKGFDEILVWQGDVVDAAYPDVQPATLVAPADAAFKRALNAARDLGWQIVAAVPNEGRIEATDTTNWFGFEDDIVVRVTPTDGGSRVDVRSVSRVGKGDLGKNAARVRAYLRRLQ